MCLFKYKEKRYGKLTFILFALLFVAIAAASVVGGIIALSKMVHWSRYIVFSLACVVALCSGIFGFALIGISFSMIWKKKSVRDQNKGKGVADVRLCDKCGRVISKAALVCEHCGMKQQQGTGMKQCPECKTKNSAMASFCEKCGYEFKD